MSEQRALRIALMAMVGVARSVSAKPLRADRLRFAGDWTSTALVHHGRKRVHSRSPLLLAGHRSQAGRGAAWEFSVLLSIVPLWFVLAAAFGQVFAVDGLIYSTFAMAIIALFSSGG